MNEAHLGLAVASWLICQQRVVYVSSGRMMVSGRINLQEGAVFSEELAGPTSDLLIPFDGIFLERLITVKRQAPRARLPEVAAQFLNNIGA